jgi:hypothetical protein
MGEKAEEVNITKSCITKLIKHYVMKAYGGVDV